MYIMCVIIVCQCSTIFTTSINDSKGLDKQNVERKIINIVLPICLSIFFRCSKEPSHCGDSFEYHNIFLVEKLEN